MLGLHRHHPLCLLFTLALLCAAVPSCSPGVRVAARQPVDHAVTIHDPEFNHAINKTTGVAWTQGNHVESLVNGDGFYPPMLKAIREAKHSITFETYAYVQGMAAYHFTTAFCERAKAGVKVHVILDKVGSLRIGEDHIKAMKRSGVQLRFYNRWSLLKPWNVNTRDHRKIMVVDGKMGFTGGCGIADAWLGNAHTPKHWRENHYCVTGPSVKQLQQAFEDN